MKLKDKKGLTLVEMLCTVAILVLVSMVMVLGVQLGVRSYAKSVSYSEAQVLCSTLTTTISDELRYSGTLKVDGSGNVTGFFSQQFGSGDYTAFTTTPEGHVQLGGKDILPAKAYPYGIKAEVKSLTYDDVFSLFTVRLSVKDSENKNTLAETTFEVKAQCDDRRHRRGPRPRRRHPQYRKLRNTAPNGMLRRRGVFAIKKLYTLCFKKV